MALDVNVKEHLHTANRREKASRVSSFTTIIEYEK